MNTPGWFLDELAHAGSEHLDASYVPGYDRKAGTDPADDLTLLRGLGLNAASTLVDLGAGTGTFALAAAPFCRRVIAVDVSPVMLGLLREKAAAQNLSNVEWVQAGFLSYQPQGDPADFVYSRHALHHLPDFWKAVALQRINGLLRTGGIFYLRDLIFSFDLSESDSVIENWLSHASKTSEIGWTRAELETHLREEYSTFRWLLEPMIERAGFQIQAVDQAPSKLYSAYTCIKVS
ncbi:MAG TPA: class I SAM-dependent methyltransferase [Phototrophicaceae bacterium]|nr:class I SAM-dependent methyltransferase [Phototrophicaceae bacterium]